ncbi:MAG TPA: hypothetical protein VMV17_07445 [Streptosporangiaceae bacterium]|nr:hypothetical protein [Streptosporangiaceae bacterium]
MADGIDQRLATAAQALREFEVTSHRCEELRSRRGELFAKVAELRADAAAGEADVGRLEGLTLSRVLASMRGARDEELARERAEVQAARYRLGQAAALLEAIGREEDAARARLAGLASAPATYAAVLAEKERHISESGDPRAGHLMELADERGRLTAEIREIAEAVQAADAAGQALAQVQERLDSASGWSTYDTFFGGGAISSAIKHSRLDEAAQAAAHADQLLAVLRTELADIDAVMPVTARLPVEGVTKFVDIWVDNFFTDLAVRDRINQARDNVTRAARLVAVVRTQLAQRDTQAYARLAAIGKERQDVLSQ